MVNEHFVFYRNKLFDVLSGVDSALENIADHLVDHIMRGKTIFVCGNGGSAAITEHMSCDFMKGINMDTKFKPKIVSLSANSSILTAVSNDIGYEESFAYQLEMMGDKGDMLIAVSSSGNSPNIIRVLKKAKKVGIYRVSFTGFDGGEAKKLSNINVHIPADNYGIIEDAHQTCMHMIAQHIRIENDRKNSELKL